MELVSFELHARGVLHFTSLPIRLPADELHWLQKYKQDLHLGSFHPIPCHAHCRVLATSINSFIFRNSSCISHNLSLSAFVTVSPLSCFSPIAS